MDSAPAHHGRVGSLYWGIGRFLFCIGSLFVFCSFMVYLVVLMVGVY